MLTNKRFMATAALTAALAITSVSSLSAQDPGHLWGKSSNTKAQAHIDEGDELLGNHKYVQARMEYETAVELISEDGDFAGPALYRIAASYYYEGKPQTAARRLDQLAAEATLYGDLVTQLWATADAAWIYGQAGNKLGMDERVVRLKLLLKSEYIPEHVRADLAAKRLGELTTLEGETE